MAESFWTKVASSFIKATAQGLERGLESLESDGRKAVAAAKQRLKDAQVVAELAASDKPLDDRVFCKKCGAYNGRHNDDCETLQSSSPH